MSRSSADHWTKVLHKDPPNDGLGINTCGKYYFNIHPALNATHALIYFAYKVALDTAKRTPDSGMVLPGARCKTTIHVQKRVGALLGVGGSRIPCTLLRFVLLLFAGFCFVGNPLP